MSRDYFQREVQEKMVVRDQRSTKNEGRTREPKDNLQLKAISFKGGKE